jgi:chromosome segregation ATPase
MNFFLRKVTGTNVSGVHLPSKRRHVSRPFFYDLSICRFENGCFSPIVPANRPQGMNTFRSLNRLLVRGFVATTMTASAFAISSEKLAELQAKAEAGNGISQYNLGLVYADPQEPIGNILEAYVWFSLAADNGAPGKALMIVTNQLTPEQLSDGKRLLEQRRADLAAHRPIVVAASAKAPEPVKTPVAASPVVVAPAEPDTTAIQAELKKASDALVTATKENQQLKTQLDKAQSQQTELEQVKQERDKLNTTVATYTNEISAMRASAANFEGERNALQQKIVEAAKQTKDSMAAELAATTAKLKTAESELTKADATTTELVTAKQTLANLNDQLQKLTGENQRLTSLIKQTETSAEEKMAASEKALTETNGELLKTQAKLTEASEKASIAASATAELAAQRQINSDLSAKLQKLTAENAESLAQASKTTTESQQQLEALDSKLKSAEETAAKASAEQADIAQQLAALKAAPPKQDPATLAQLTKVSAELETAQHNAAAEKEALTAQLKSAEEAAAKASTEQAELAKQLAVLKAAPPKQDTEAQAQLAKVSTELETAQRAAALEKETLVAKLKTAEESLASAGADRAQLAQLKAQLDGARAENTNRQANNAELENRGKQITELQAKLKSSETALAVAVGDKAELEQKLKAAKPSKKEAAAQAKIEELKAELESARAENSKNQAYAVELDDARKEITDLQSKLKSSQEELAVAKSTPPVTAPAAETPATAVAATTTEPSPDLQKELNEAQLKLDASLRSYQLQQNEIERLQNALANIDTERAKLAERLQTANSEAASATSKATSGEAASAQLAGVREQLRQTQNQLASIAYENTELKHRIAFMAPTQGSITPLPVSAPTVTYNTPNRPGAIKQASIEKPAAPAAAAPRTHTVASGETLSTIAKRYYGSASRWPELLEANKPALRDPAALRVGMKIKIP